MSFPKLARTTCLLSLFVLQSAISVIACSSNDLSGKDAGMIPSDSATHPTIQSNSPGGNNQPVIDQEAIKRANLRPVDRGRAQAFLLTANNRLWMCTENPSIIDSGSSKRSETYQITVAACPRNQIIGSCNLDDIVFYYYEATPEHWWRPNDCRNGFKDNYHHLYDLEKGIMFPPGIVEKPAGKALVSVSIMTNKVEFCHEFETAQDSEPTTVAGAYPVRVEQCPKSEMVQKCADVHGGTSYAYLSTDKSGFLYKTCWKWQNI